jgi:hypothetical protein
MYFGSTEPFQTLCHRLSPRTTCAP